MCRLQMLGKKIVGFEKFGLADFLGNSAEEKWGS
jgi:hypothetical protein